MLTKKRFFSHHYVVFLVIRAKKAKKRPRFLGANLGSWVKSRELKPTRVQIKFVNCYVY